MGLNGCMGVDRIGGLIAAPFVDGGSEFSLPANLSCLRAIACVAARTVAITAWVRCRAYCLGDLREREREREGGRDGGREREREMKVI